MESRIVARASDQADAHGTALSVNRQDAGWEFISFRLWRLSEGQEIEDDSADEEIGLIVLSGRITVITSSQSWENIGERQSVFDGKPFVVYLPPRTRFSVRAATGAEVVRAGAKAERGAEPCLITPAEIGDEVRGEGNAQRHIRHLLEADRPAEHLFLVEVITPSGNWSSYPPHKHDTNDPPRETYLEETYFHRIQPPQGFGFQRVYTSDGELDDAVVIEDGTLVMVPKGYHPAVIAPGYDLYYLNVMAGPRREWRFTDDPDHAWVAEGWKPYGEPPVPATER